MDTNQMVNQTIERVQKKKRLKRSNQSIDIQQQQQKTIKEIIINF